MEATHHALLDLPVEFGCFEMCAIVEGAGWAGVDGRKVAFGVHHGLQQYGESFIPVSVVCRNDAIGGCRNVDMGAINCSNAIWHPLLCLECRSDSGESPAAWPSNQVSEVCTNS